jgi:hypothetical protein
MGVFGGNWMGFIPRIHLTPSPSQPSILVIFGPAI